MSKTIKEVADELGVSKDKVKYQVRKLPSELTTKKSGVTYLGNRAISIIKDNLQGSVTQVENKNSPSDFLLEQLAKSDKLLTEKDLQIKKLLESQEMFQKLLDQQQILTLQANKKIEQLELQVADDDETKGRVDQQQSPHAESEPVENKSFFSRLFNR